ncbi:MAG: outer membrane lipoprotein-sorting protein [Gammaproteobacteria bacterium]|nr:outer membrane lipoprotein-sorting protein [Gammaproteobacteria bacterium]
MHKRRRASVIGIVLYTLTFGAVAFDTARIEDPDVRACADRALPTKTATQVQKVQVVGANGYVRESKRKVYWKRSPNNDSRVLVRVMEPPDEKGIGVLINDNAETNVVTYMTYSPKIKRVRRVSGESFFGSILGTDFTYEDFSYFYRVDEREEVARVEDSDVDGHPAYVLETVKPDDNSHYSMLRFYIDKEVCLPVQTDFFAPNGALRKQLTVERSEIQLVDDHWVPFRTTMTDLKFKTHSVFIVEEIEIDPELDDGIFETSELSRGGN